VSCDGFVRFATVTPGSSDNVCSTNVWVCPGNRLSGRVLLIGGLPLNEPIARYGPFVMNTEKEIREAFEDYESGRMGAINF